MLLPSILPCLGFALLTPLVVSVQNLEPYNVAVVLERFFSLAGILLLTPVPLPEADNSIREVVASRYTALTGITALRFLLLLPLLPMLVGTLCGVMAAAGSTVPLAYWLGGSVTAFALGALGFFTFSVTGNWIAGYLAPVCYYAINMGLGQKLGAFYLFSLEMGSLVEKYWLLATGVLLAAAALAAQKLAYHLRGV